MPDAHETLESIQQMALDAYCAEHERLIDNWKGLETKAQGAVTIAGIFIAGVFAFIRDLKSLNMDGARRGLLMAAVTLLVFSVILSILVLSLRTVLVPPTGVEVNRMVTDVCGIKDFGADDVALLAQLKLRVIRERVKLWHKTVASVEQSMRWKVIYLRGAQGLLVLAIVLVVGLTISTIRVSG